MPEEFKFQSGTREDDRPIEEKEKDIEFKEIVAAAAPVIWKEKTESQWRTFPVISQDGSGSCVAQTMGKLMGVVYWLVNKVYIHFSPTHIYQRRVNKPDGGMTAADVFKIAQDGVTLEIFTPSEELSDREMDSAIIEDFKKQVGQVFKSGKPIILPDGDFDTIASVIQQTGKAVMTWFYFTEKEWSKLIPTVINTLLNRNDLAALRHSVACVDYFTMNGVQYLLVEDTAWFGGIKRRLITREFCSARNYFAGHVMNFRYEDSTNPELPQPSPTPKPKYKFLHVLNFKTTNPDVKALQDILKYEGCFPVNTQSTGYYGSTTAESVYKFQVKHNVAPLSELNSLQGKTVGSKTIAVLNQLYS